MNSTSIEKLETWNDLVDKKPMLIAGPCSAETEEQTLQTAIKLSINGVKIFRAGIWKPRTRPGGFEGVGAKGLKWLKKVKETTGMKVSTEVANIKHVYEALKAGIDILWIGARTTTNPFAIQEIADALKGVDIPVMIKNPLNPDINLWIGAIERFQASGITKIAAIHRGFSTYEKTIYRNIPTWQIPIELKRRIPDLPIICDPSHISGNRELLQQVSQTAMDLDFRGLMIEVHNDPDKAWSDAKQQITPERMDELCKTMKIREIKPKGISLETLDDLRLKIDNFDNELLELLSKRMKTAEAIGKYKKQSNMTVLQSDRWKQLLEQNIHKGKKLDLSAEFISKIFKAIHIESINKQEEILQK